MPNPAHVADIEARFHPLSTQERKNAEAYLEDAWWMLTTRQPTLDADLSAGTVSVGNTIRVLTAMVLRILRNPDGKLSESVDDYRFTRSELVASGALEVTSAELGDLTPGGRRSVRSIRLVAYGEH